MSIGGTQPVNSESLPAWKLSDRQLLEVMRGRGNDLATAKSLAFLCRMFAQAVERDIVLAPGLKAAIGLTQLYGLGIAPGHEDHPFKDVDKNMTVASILDRSAQIKVERYIPAEIKHRSTRPPLDMETHSPMPLTVEHGRMQGCTVLVQNVPRPPRQSKSAKVAEIALAREGSFTAKELAVFCPPGFSYQDVQNGISLALRRGQIIKCDSGYPQRYAVFNPVANPGTPE